MNLTAKDQKIIKFYTSRFGEITITEDKVISFVHGIPGFERLRRYILIDHDPEGNFKWLQAVDDPMVAFLLTDPNTFRPDYRVFLSKSDLKTLGADGLQGLVTLVMVCFDREKSVMSLNMKGPIVFNSLNMTARQFIIDREDYPCRYEVELKRTEESKKR